MFVHSISITKCSDEKGPNPVELQLVVVFVFFHAPFGGILRGICGIKHGPFHRPINALSAEDGNLEICSLPLVPPFPSATWTVHRRRLIGEATGHGQRWQVVTIWRWLSCWNMRNTDFWCEFWRISGLSQKPKTGNRRESYFVDFYAHDQNLGQVDQALRRTVFDLLISLLWFIYGFLSDSARFSMVFVSFVQGDATRNHWVIFGGQNLALRNKGFLHLTGEICIIIIIYIYTLHIYIYLFTYNLYIDAIYI